MEPEGRQPQSLSARSHRKAADAAGRSRPGRVAVASLAECRQIRSGPAAWQSMSLQTGGRRATPGAHSAQPHSMAPAAPGDDERVLGLFETPARRQAKLSPSRPSTGGDSWQTMSMPSRPGTGATLLPSLNTPRHLIFSQTLGPQSHRSPRGPSTNEISESSDDEHIENCEAFSKTSCTAGIRRVAGAISSSRRSDAGPSSSWGFYDSDEDGKTKPSKHSLGDFLPGACFPSLDRDYVLIDTRMPVKTQFS